MRLTQGAASRHASSPTTLSRFAMRSPPPRRRARRISRKRARHWTHFTPGSALERRLRRLLCPSANTIVNRILRDTSGNSEQAVCAAASPCPPAGDFALEKKDVVHIPPLQLSQMSDAVDILLLASQSQEAADQLSDEPRQHD
ncbi:unnamed protein product [Agarophyton chilense]